MKKLEKEKKWREMCRAEARAGRINLPDGKFGMGSANSMRDNQLAGYRVATGRRKKAA